MPFNIGPGELILILVIALVVLGPGKLPDVAASLGKSIREFRRAASDVSEAGKLDAPPPAAPSATASTPAAATTPPEPPAAPSAPAAPAATSPGAGPAAPAEPARDSNPT